MVKIIKFFKIHFFNLMSIITIGFPFAAYKFLAGDIIMNALDGALCLVLFYFFSIWAIVDFMLNFNAMMNILISGKNHDPVCFLAFIAKKMSKLLRIKGIGEALDLFLSFSMVACIVGGCLLSKLSDGYIYLWNISTVVNVLGAGVVRLALLFFEEFDRK